MILTGYTLVVAQALRPDLIIAPAFAESGDPALLAAHCLEQVEATLAERAREGDILVVAGHVAAGAGLESALLAFQALGLAALICSSADQACVEASGSLGLPLLVQAAASAGLESGRLVRLDLARGCIEDQATRTVWPCEPCPAGVLASVRRVQLLARMRRFVEDEGLAE